MMHTVFIDGVEYIPAKEANANTLAIAKGLLMSFYGDCDDAKAKELIKNPDIRVLVNDWGEGETISAVLDEIAKQA